jgi:hypothetical protein
LILVAAGIIIMALPAQEAEYETITVKTWELEGEVLSPQDGPYNSTFYASMMNESRWFQLNISSSDTVRVEISIVQHAPTTVKQRVAGPFIGTRFTQKAEPTITATYYIDIYNDGSTEVALYGNVLVEQRNALYHTVFLYVMPGTLVMLVGIITLVVGVFKKVGKPARSRSKR